MITEAITYKTLEEVCKGAVSEYNSWLKERVTTIDQLTGEVIVAVNGYTNKTVKKKNLKLPVDINNGYGWRSAVEAYFEEMGL